MALKFSKYHGAGNDFILIDDRQGEFGPDKQERIARLCHRRFGIGGDGLMLLRNKAGYDFEMKYYNADGREGTMCGNGGRCIAAFARDLGIIGSKAHFMAVDGQHLANIEGHTVDLQMADVGEVRRGKGHFFMDTGSPHYVTFVDEMGKTDVDGAGKAIRHDKNVNAEGCNVNFVQITGKALHVRTYERGVEAETLACGTGIVASVLAAALKTGKGPGEYPVQAQGGKLSVRFSEKNGKYTDIWLKGPTEFVFEGMI